MTTEKTYWRGVETPARRVRVIVGRAPSYAHWAADLEGTERDAVEVTLAGETFYIDDADGSGWNVVTRRFAEGGYKRVPVERVLTPARNGR